jgi:hypothetical protein
MIQREKHKHTHMITCVHHPPSSEILTSSHDHMCTPTTIFKSYYLQFTITCVHLETMLKKLQIILKITNNLKRKKINTHQISNHQH